MSTLVVQDTPMTDSKILVPTDFAQPAAKALQQGVALAKLTNSSLILLHLTDHDNEQESSKKQMAQLCRSIKEKHNVSTEFIVETGDIYEDIGRIADRQKIQFVVMGTQGLHGIAQHLFGARIIKILRSINIPTIVVQDKTPVSDQFDKILLPVDDIDRFEEKILSLMPFARWSDAEIMLYAIRHPMKNEQKIREHLTLSRKILGEANLNFTETAEPPTVFSVGIAKQTLRFSKTWGANLIVISLGETENMANLNEADCERLLNNKQEIAILYAPENLGHTGLFS